MSPASEDKHATSFPTNLTSVIFVTTSHENLSPAALALVQMVVGVGDAANEVIAKFCLQTGEAAPAPTAKPQDDQVLFWRRGSGGNALLVAVATAKQAHQRHIRKYAEGRLGEDKSFYFRGAKGVLNLRAHNLGTFLQMAQGIDDETWLFHLRRGDYTRWFRDAISDDDLATEAAAVESEPDPGVSRRTMAEAITRRYAAAGAGAG